jgi:hypothetical protein
MGPNGGSLDMDSVFTSLHLRSPVYVVLPLPSLRDFGHVGVSCTFSNTPAAAATAGIVRPRSLAAHWQGRRYDPPITEQIIAPHPLSSSQVGQGQFSTALGSVTSTTRGGTTWTGDFKCKEVKTGFCKNRSMQTGSSGTLIGWKSGQTTFVPLWNRTEGAWLRTQLCTWRPNKFWRSNSIPMTVTEPILVPAAFVINNCTDRISTSWNQYEKKNL